MIWAISQMVLLMQFLLNIHSASSISAGFHPQTVCILINVDLNQPGMQMLVYDSFQLMLSKKAYSAFLVVLSFMGISICYLWFGNIAAIWQSYIVESYIVGLMAKEALIVGI